MSEKPDLEAFLEMVSKGCVSGNINDWPQLKPACEYAFKKITKAKLLINNLRDLLPSFNFALLKAANATREFSEVIERLDTALEEKGD